MTKKDKELQDALQRLEDCCPGSTCSSNQQTSSSELHEALLNLDHARKEEQRLRKESDALLEGMDIIISSDSTIKAFNLVLEVLKRLLNFDDSFVLREQENGCLSTVASSSPQFENLVWQPDAMLKHVLKGNSVNINDISNSNDWQGQPKEVRHNVSAALHTPFNTFTDRAMLVCTSSQKDFFNKSRIQLLERFSPLAGEALYNLQINDRLRDEIDERKQAEESLEAALTDLRNTQKELLTTNEALTQEIKERQKAEDALRVANDELELRVEKRTKELQNNNIMLQREISERRQAEKEKEKIFAQLLQSQKMESVGLLAGGIAHDFNNILSVILGQSEISIMTMPKDDPLRPRMESIYKAGEKASSLTRQLLAFSRKQIMETKIINLNILITNMAKMLGRLIGENIELKLDLKKQICNIKADPGQIEQILLNLSVNSRDAMPHGGRLDIRTEDIVLDEKETAGLADISPGAYVRLSFQDSGEGMTKEVQKEIFEPFFTTKALGKGTGLGLATVYGIVKQHNGYIYVDSEKDKGTLFSIYFPISKNEVSGSELALPEMNTFRRGSEVVLIVDDDASIRSFVTETLTSLGYRCLSAPNGKEALQLAQSSRETINLLLTDVVMPEMNGPELVTLFKKLFPESKIIFMSGHIFDDVSSENIVRKEAFIQKPITPTKLLSKLGEVLPPLK